MADRGALYLREVEAFAAWAVGLGCKPVPVTNPYELLRLELPETLRRPGEPRVWICWRHERENHKGNPSEHAVVRDDGLWLVRRYRKRQVSDG